MYFQKLHCAMPIFDNKSVFIDEESLGQIIKVSPHCVDTSLFCFHGILFSSIN